MVEIIMDKSQPKAIILSLNLRITAILFIATILLFESKRIYENRKLKFIVKKIQKPLYFLIYAYPLSIETQKNFMPKFPKKEIDDIQYFYSLKNMLKEVIILLLFTAIQSQYNVNLDFPLILDNSQANISTVNYDNKNGFYVGFTDKQFRHYSYDFSNFSSFNFTYVMNFASTWWCSLNNITLSNGTKWSTNSIMGAAMGNNYQAFSLFNYTTSTQLFSYSINEKIVLLWGFPVQYFSTFIPHNVLICNETLKVIYNGVIYNTLNYSQVYQTGVVCDSAVFNQWYISNGVDYYQFKYFYFVSLSNKQVLNLTLILNFTMNYASSTFDLSYNIMRSMIFSSPDRISKLFLTNSLLLMQSNTTGAMHLYSIAAGNMGIVDSAIPKNQVFSFFNKFNNFYLLQSNGLISVGYSSVNNTIYYASTVSTLPYNTYRLSFGSKFDILYIPNTPYIYKTGQCMNQSLRDGNDTCQQYSCLIANCLSCSFTSAVCSICNPGFTRNEFYQCVNSNITQNSTSNSSNNSLQKQYQLSSYMFSFLDSQWILEFMDYIIQVFKVVISFPAARRLVTPLFYYFGNFDDLFLYSYHNREYGDTMNSIFQQISAIEKQKWSLLSLDQLSSIISLNITKIQSEFGFQRQYLPKLALDYLGFFENCCNFILVEVPIILLGFIILKLVFRALSNYSISQIFRRFDFWIYFAIILFDGNVQQFSFYLTPELKTVFAFELINKYVKVFIIFVGYCLFIFTVCGYVIGLSFYKKLNHYFTDNNKNILHGNWILILQNGIRNMMLGITHSLFGNVNYSILISILLIIENIFLVIFLLGISYKVYIENKIIWIYNMFTLLRILLIFAFYMDRKCINYTVFEQVQRILIFQMVILYTLSTILLLYQTVVQCVIFLRKMCKRKKESSCQIRNSLLTDQSYLDKVVLFEPYSSIMIPDKRNHRKESKQAFNLLTTKSKGVKIIFRKVKSHK